MEEKAKVDNEVIMTFFKIMAVGAKNANSDTIIIRHRGGEYTFVVEQLIKKQVGR